jgi:hypothetical protein
MIVGAALVALAVAAGHASAGVFCKKKSGVVVARDASCRSKETLLSAADYGLQGPKGDQGLQGPSGPGAIVGYGSVDKDGNVRGFGGSSTTNVSVLANGAEYTVTLTGTFTVPTDINAYTLLCTAESDDYQVCNAYVDGVSASSITIVVYTFNGYNADLAGGFSFALLAPTGS